MWPLKALNFKVSFVVFSQEAKIQLRRFKKDLLNLGFKAYFSKEKVNLR